LYLSSWHDRAELLLLIPSCDTHIVARLEGPSLTLDTTPRTTSARVQTTISYLRTPHDRFLPSRIHHSCSARANSQYETGAYLMPSTSGLVLGLPRLPYARLIENRARLHCRSASRPNHALDVSEAFPHPSPVQLASLTVCS
jgi:hypothetical protein